MRTHFRHTIGCLSFITVFAQPLHAAELGFSIGSLFKASDIATPIWVYYQQYSSQPMLVFAESTINSINSLRKISSPLGQRSAASYIDLIWVAEIPPPGLEVENSCAGAFGASMSAKPHTLIFSSNLNYVFPWYPEFLLWKIKPFVGAGLGYTFNFGTNYGKYAQEEHIVLPNEKRIPVQLGNNGAMHYSLGGGGKIHVWKDWWLRLTLRSFVMPSTSRLHLDYVWVSSNPENPYEGSSEPVFYKKNDTTYHLSFSISMVKNLTK